MAAAPSNLSRLQQLQQEEENFIRGYLTKQLHMRGTFPGTVAQMGTTTTFCTSITFQKFSESARYANQMPALKEVINPDSLAVAEYSKETMEMLMQRPPDWTRQLPMALYLLTQPHRIFPSILMVVMESWAFDDTDDEYWQADEHNVRRAKKSTLTFTFLDSDNKLGYVQLDPDKQVAYTLDGQHRQMGIEAALLLLKGKSLTILNSLGKPTKVSMTLAEIVDKYNLDEVKLQNLGSESIGMQLIPGVQAGETLEEARRRVRSIFVHVNEYANKLTKGQSYQIDEDNGFKIVARVAAVTHPMFRDGKEVMVNMSSTTVAMRARVLTTLPTLGEMAESYLGARQPFKAWTPDTRGLIPLRPDEEQLKEAIDVFMDFLTKLSGLPCFVRIKEGESPARIRNTSKDEPQGKAHMLFRPIGQQALTTALSYLVHKRKADLDELFTALQEYDADNGFNMEDRTQPWYGVLLDANTSRMKVSGESLAARLLIHMLGGGTEDPGKRAELRSDFAMMRLIKDEIALNLEDEEVNIDDVQLPAPI
jgi:DGQHR domain-containing protein